MIDRPVSVLPSFQMLVLIILVTWDSALMNNTLRVKQDHQHAPDVQPDFLPSLVTDRLNFSTERIAGWFLGHNSKAKFHFLRFQSIFSHIRGKTEHKCIAHRIECSKISDSTYHTQQKTPPVRSKVGSYGCKIYYTNSEDTDTKAPSGRKLYYLPFCILVTSLGNFKYIFKPPGIRIKLQNITSVTTYTACPRRNGQNFGRVFLTLNYTDITQNTYVQS